MDDRIPLSDEMPGRIRPFSRRAFLQRMAVFGLTLPAAGALLAACGGDDPTPTQAPAQATATPAGTDTEPTATPVEDATPEPVEPTATTAADEPTPTTASVEPTPTTAAEMPTEMYGYEITPAEHTGGTLVRATPWGTSDGYILNNYGVYEIAEAMTEAHPQTNEPMPVLATSWEANEDGTQWTFALREGVQFHDGETLSAEDVIFNFTWRNKAGWGIYSILAAAQAEAADDMTVVLTVDSPLPDAALGAADYLILSAASLSDIDPETVTEDQINQHPVNIGQELERYAGTGPFMYAELVSGEFERLVRFDEYWGGRPHLDEIITRNFASADAIVPSVLSGEVDVSGVWSYLNPGQVEALAGADAQVVSFAGSQIGHVTFNLDPERVPFFAERDVRHALLHAVDREGLVEAALLGYGRVINATVVVEDWYDPSAIPTYDFDPDRANELLDAAGWELGSDGVRARDGVRFEFELLIGSGDTVAETAAVILQEQWRAIGVAMTPVPEQSEAMLDKRMTGDFDAIMLLTMWGLSQDQSVHFACGATSFNTSYCNEELDVLMTEAVSEVDPDQRRELLTQILATVMDELPRLTLFSPDGIVAVSNRVHNVYPNALNPTFNPETWWVEP